MQWDAIQTEARDAGYLVYAMDQSQTDAMTQPGPWGSAYSGYCQGMAVRWTWLRYQGSDFPYDGTKKVYAATDWQATAIQNIYEDQEKSGGEVDHWRKAAAAYSMSVNEGLLLSRAHPPAGAIVNLMLTSAVGCYGISVKRDGGGHAIAAENEGGKQFHLFDANYGHFVAQGADEFRDFLDWYFAKTGYADRYKKETFICGIDKP